MCSDPRDKIYSLLAMVRDAASIQVDYDITLTQLALDVLKCYPDRFCLCQARLLLQTLEISKLSPVEHVAYKDDQCFAELYGQAIPVNAFSCHLCGDPVHANILQQSLSMGRLYMYCLTCDHSALSTAQQCNHFGHIVIQLQELESCRVYHFEKERGECCYIREGVQVVTRGEEHDEVGIRIPVGTLCQLACSDSPQVDSMHNALGDCAQTLGSLRWKLISESSSPAHEIQDYSAEGLVQLFDLSTRRDSEYRSQDRIDHSHRPINFLVQWEED